jgi:hypothetical protein
MEDLEDRLRRSLRQPMPPAPASLRGRLDVAALAAAPGPRRSQPLVWSVVAAAVAIVSCISVVVLVARQPTGNQQASVAPSVAASRPATGVSLPGHQQTPPPVPSELRVPPIDYPGSLSVSEFITRRDAGELGSDSIILRGYWTNRSVGHSCSAPDSPPGELEIRCHDGESGITELDEPIGTLTTDSRFIPAQGPAITPFVDRGLQARLFGLPYIHEQWYPPVPIVVRGHINDPRASECRPEARDLCKDRFVIDEILAFDPEAVPTPGITPSPSPFPFADPPPPPFTKAECAGDVPYRFVGWGHFSDFGLGPAGSDDVAYLMITAGEAQIRGKGRKAKWVCYAHEWDHGTMTYFTLPSQ